MRKALFLSAIIISGMSFVACAQQSKQTRQTEESTQTQESKKGGEVISINANYMKEHIYDFEASPKEFIYKGSVPAIIDFYADWCGPCRRLAPKLKKVAEKYGDKIQIYKVNVDENPQLAGLFGVQSIPMVLFVPITGAPYQTQGDLPMEYIEEMIAKIQAPETEAK